MRKILIILALVTVTVSLSGCLGSEVTQIDQLTDPINNHMSSGDNYFNQAATSTNKYQYDDAQDQVNNASSEFNQAKTMSQEASVYAKSLQDALYSTYFQLTLLQLDAKINATNELKLAIPLFMRNDTRSGNSHVDQANQFMQQSLDYQNQKDDLVSQNPTKFKSQ